MPIYQRGSTWWYSITINGKTVRKSCQTEDKREALEFHDRKRAEMWRTSVAGDKSRRTWDETVSRWLTEHEHKRSHRDDIRYADFWNESFQSNNVRFLDQITPDLVKSIRESELARKRQRGRGTITPSTVNRKLAFLRTVVNAAYREYQYIDGAAPLFKLLPENSERMRFLTPSELHRLLQSLPEPYSSLAKFAVATGLRQGNCINLKWDFVDMSKRIVTFKDTLMKNGQALTVPLNNMAVHAIMPWVGKHRDFVFVRMDGEKVNGIPAKTWRIALKKAGIENFRWHDLRHTWASIMRQGGVGLDVLQELGGWKQSRMVQRYAHLSVDHLANHSNRFDQLVGTPTVQILHSEGEEKRVA
jgi:integrase